MSTKKLLKLSILLLKKKRSRRVGFQAIPWDLFSKATHSMFRSWSRFSVQIAEHYFQKLFYKLVFVLVRMSPFMSALLQWPGISQNTESSFIEKEKEVPKLISCYLLQDQSIIRYVENKLTRWKRLMKNVWRFCKKRKCYTFFNTVSWHYIKSLNLLVMEHVKSKISNPDLGEKDRFSDSDN